jgi:hypothetical protein
MCAAARTKRQAVAAAPLPVVAMASSCPPEHSRHPSGIILDVVGTAGTNRGCSCKEHACCSDVLDNDVLIKLWREQILVLDAVTRGGKMKEETAINVNWVSKGIDRCCIGFLPNAFIVRGSLWDGILCQGVEVFGKDDPSSRAKWHRNKGFPPICYHRHVASVVWHQQFPLEDGQGSEGSGKKEG